MTAGRSVRAATAALMSLILIAVVGVRPAQAVDPGTVVKVIQQIYSVYKQFTAGGGGLTLDQATVQIITAIGSAQTNIIGEIDGVSSAQARACAESAVIDFRDIRSFTPDTLQAFARDSTSCVTLIDSLLPVLQDKASIDRLGFALNAVGPIALVARSRAGLTTPTLVGALIDANNQVVSSIAPPCVVTVIDRSGIPPPHNGDTVSFITTCTAYNGDTGTQNVTVIYPPSSNPVDLPAVRQIAARNISYDAAVAVLPILQSLPH